MRNPVDATTGHGPGALVPLFPIPPLHLVHNAIAYAPRSMLAIGSMLAIP